MKAYLRGDPPTANPYSELEIRKRCEWGAGYWDTDTEQNGYRQVYRVPCWSAEKSEKRV